MKELAELLETREDNYVPNADLLNEMAAYNNHVINGCCSKSIQTFLNARKSKNLQILQSFFADFDLRDNFFHFSFIRFRDIVVVEVAI